MTKTFSSDLDYLVTRLHARRSRLAEGGRLDDLCRSAGVPGLERAVCPDGEFAVPADFQRRLVEDLAAELAGCLKHLEGNGHDYIAWLLVRFQVENIKVLLRGFLNRTPFELLAPQMVSLPAGLMPEARALLAVKSPEEFAALLLAGAPRNRLAPLLSGQRDPPYSFLLEAALDAGYFQELTGRSRRLEGGEAEIVAPMVAQESNLFQFMLVLRGRFHFGLSAESLRPFGVGGSGANSEWFEQLLAAPDLSAAVKLGLGKVMDEPPAAGRSPEGSPPLDLAAVEALAWQRYLRLASSAFYRSHMGVGAVAGYFGLRRIEIANLVTVSEGIRLGLEERKIRARLTTRTDREAAYV